MEREVSRLRRSFGSGAAGPRSVTVVGVGRDTAIAGTRALLESAHRPERLLCLGFAGALREELATGDLVLARRVYTDDEDGAVECDEDMLKEVQEALGGSPGYHVADSLTVGRPVCTVAQKRGLAEATGAWVANMEDYWIGRVAAQYGVPFLSVRAVVDTAGQELSPFVASLGHRRPPFQALLAASYCVLRPAALPSLLRLSRQARVAGASLESLAVSLVAAPAGDRRPAGATP